VRTAVRPGAIRPIRVVVTALVRPPSLSSGIEFTVRSRSQRPPAFDQTDATVAIITTPATMLMIATIRGILAMGILLHDGGRADQP
jgi:hypothetical protein